MSGDVQVFDLRDVPCELAASRWTPHVPRDPADLRGVVLHSWGTPVGTTFAARRRFGEARALALRSLAAPYTVTAGVTRAGVPVVAIAHPVERYTYASDAGNAHYLAVGVMGLFPFTEDRRKPKHSAMTEGLAAAIDKALDVAASLLPEGPHALVTHRQCINGKGDHAACPGEAVVAAALRSQAVICGALVPDPDLVLVAEFGRVWPVEWRRHLG